MRLTLAKAVLGAAPLVAAPASAGGFTNHIGMRFVDVPAGGFWMGSCELTAAQIEENKKRAVLDQAPVGENCPPGARPDPDADDSETPQRRVRIGAFQMGVFEVTLGQYKQFMEFYTAMATDDLIKSVDEVDSVEVRLGKGGNSERPSSI